jgi:hypothetical protein
MLGKVFQDAAERIVVELMGRHSVPLDKIGSG